MISLTCTSCQAKLQVDDGFAGGVCRCMYCGTIQTVPSHLKRSSNGMKPTVVKPQATKVLVHNSLHLSNEHAPPNEDSDAPSSGLAGSGLISGRLRAESIARQRPSWKKRILLFGICGVGALLLLLTIFWIAIS